MRSIIHIANEEGKPSPYSTSFRKPRWTKSNVFCKSICGIHQGDILFFIYLLNSSCAAWKWWWPTGNPIEWHLISKLLIKFDPVSIKSRSTFIPNVTLNNACLISYNVTDFTSWALCSFDTSFPWLRTLGGRIVLGSSDPSRYWNCLTNL